MTTDNVEGLEFSAHLPTVGSYDWPRIADILRQNPGQWTLAFRQERYSLALAIRNGSIKALHPDNGFRYATRNNSRSRPRIADIYLSYQPEHDKHREERLDASENYDGRSPNRRP